MSEHQMGPVESWVRFLLIVMVGVVIFGSIIWFIIYIDGPWWGIVANILILLIYIVIAYERVIGW